MFDDGASMVEGLIAGMDSQRDELEAAAAQLADDVRSAFAPEVLPRIGVAGAFDMNQTVSVQVEAGTAADPVTVAARSATTSTRTSPRPDVVRRCSVGRLPITPDDVTVQVESSRTDVWVPEGLAVRKLPYTPEESRSRTTPRPGLRAPVFAVAKACRSADSPGR